MTKSVTLDDLTPEQRERLLQFAKAHGKSWKEPLSILWWNGTDADQDQGHLLRQIRNQHGPQWLDSLEL